MFIDPLVAIVLSQPTSPKFDSVRSIIIDDELVLFMISFYEYYVMSFAYQHLCGNGDSSAVFECRKNHVDIYVYECTKIER